MASNSRFNGIVTINQGQFWDAASKARLRSFQDLVLDRVQRILLVSSLYDSFILSEEGQLQDTLVGQFHDLNLSQVPDLTRVTGGAEAETFQPMNINFGLFPPIDLRNEKGRRVKGRARKQAMAHRALDDLAAWIG